MTPGLLARHGLAVADIDHWAIHPAEPRIIDTVARRFGLTDDAVAASADVLRWHGNCSLATVLLVVDEIVRSRNPSVGDYVVAMALGPGAHALRRTLRVR